MYEQLSIVREADADCFQGISPEDLRELTPLARLGPTGALTAAAQLYR